MTDSRLYRWPTAAYFGRTIPKSAIYSRGTSSAPVRQLLVDRVQRITWAFKLAESTLRLPADSAMPEIQVLVVDARHDDVPDRALAAIDIAIPQPIIFEIRRGTEMRMVAALKGLGAGTSKVSSYYSTTWVPEDVGRVPLPTAITLNAMYTAILEPLLPVATRPGESVHEVAGRLRDARSLAREIAGLERKIRAERQFNRKVDLQRALIAKQHELETVKEGFSGKASPDLT